MTALPYPHARNDCEGCRERDADVLVLDEWNGAPSERPVQLCSQCAGMQVALRAIHMSGDKLDQPVTITVTVAPGRRGDDPAHAPGDPDASR